jgi:hypothetical protein
VRTERRTRWPARAGQSGEFRRDGPFARRREASTGARAVLIARFQVDPEEAFLCHGRLATATTLTVPLIASTLMDLAVRDPRPEPDAMLAHRVLHGVRAEAARRAQRA